MDVRHFSTWLDDTPAGRVYAATHGGRGPALARYQAEASAEMSRLRDAARDYEQAYPEPSPADVLPDGDDDVSGTLARYDNAMHARHKAHVEQMRYGPAVRLETGPSMAGSTADIAAALRRQHPLWGVEAGAESHDRAVKMGTPDRQSPGGIAWEDVNG
jgi:hypothetical protein